MALNLIGAVANALNISYAFYFWFAAGFFGLAFFAHKRQYGMITNTVFFQITNITAIIIRWH